MLNSCCYDHDCFLQSYDMFLAKTKTKIIVHLECVFLKKSFNFCFLNLSIDNLILLYAIFSNVFCKTIWSNCNGLLLY